MSKLSVCVGRCYVWQASFQLLNKYNDYQEICYESYATGGHHDLLMFNIP